MRSICWPTAGCMRPPTGATTPCSNAAQAVLAAFGVAPAKTHSGVRNLFGRHIVSGNHMDRRFATALREAAELREEADYSIYANVGEADVRTLTNQAEEFLAEAVKLASPSP